MENGKVTLVSNVPFLLLSELGDIEHEMSGM